MAEQEYESFDSSKKGRIDDELLPNLDDALLRTVRMRKNQASKCKSVARNIVANSLKYYSNVTVHAENVEDASILESLDINRYGPLDFSVAQNISTFSKELTSCLNEMNDLKYSSQSNPNADVKENEKVKRGRFSRIKSNHLIPLYN